MRYLPKHLLCMVLKSILIPLVSALVMALIWDLLDWMRNYGSGLPLIPHLTNLPEYLVNVDSNRHYSIVDHFIHWYNFTFLGAARFGTALGIVLGGIYVLCTVRLSGEKYVAAIIVGLIVGGRVALLFSSSSHLLVGGLLIGSIVGGLSSLLIGTSRTRLQT